jgi:hypothetical protein
MSEPRIQNAFSVAEAWPPAVVASAARTLGLAIHLRLVPDNEAFGKRRTSLL